MKCVEHFANFIKVCDEGVVSEVKLSRDVNLPAQICVHGGAFEFAHAALSLCDVRRIYKAADQTNDFYSLIGQQLETSAHVSGAVSVLT